MRSTAHAPHPEVALRHVRRWRQLRRTAALTLCLVSLATAPGCARTLYNFGAIEPGRILRSAQPSPLFLRWLTARHGVRTLINLRGRTPGFESRYAAEQGIRLYSFDLSATEPPSQADVERFLAILDDPQSYPILVHCRQGVDRTGYMLAIYRMQRQGWTAEQALAEMRAFRQFEVLNPVPAAVVAEDARAAD
jgi:tyrosine-protein phosphatase SIW14